MTSEAYPRPDRSGFKTHFEHTPDNGVLDIGWQEGIFSDGRPYRAEYWVEDHVSVLTFFLSTRGLENYSNEDFVRLLEREVSLKFKSSQQTYLDAAKFVDPSGNEMWTVNLVVGDEDETFIEGGPPLNRYAKPAGKDAGKHSQRPRSEGQSDGG